MPVDYVSVRSYDMLHEHPKLELLDISNNIKENIPSRALLQSALLFETLSHGARQDKAFLESQTLDLATTALNAIKSPTSNEVTEMIIAARLFANYKEQVFATQIVATLVHNGFPLSSGQKADLKSIKDMIAIRSDDPLAHEIDEACK